MGARIVGNKPGKSTRQTRDKLSNPAPDGTKSFATPVFAHEHTDKKDKYSDDIAKAFLSGHRKKLGEARSEPDENGRFLQRMVTSQHDMDIKKPYEQLLSLFDTDFNEFKVPGVDDDFVSFVTQQFKDNPELAKQSATIALSKILNSINATDSDLKTQNDVANRFDLPSIALTSRLAALNSPKVNKDDPYGTFQPFVDLLKALKKLPTRADTGTKIPRGLSIEQVLMGPLFDENNQPLLDLEGKPVIGPLTDIDRYPFSIPKNIQESGIDLNDVYDYILSDLSVPLNRSVPLAKEDLERNMDDQSGETAGSFVHTPSERMQLEDTMKALKDTAKYLDTVREGNRNEWQSAADYINDWRNEVPGDMVYNHLLVPALLDGTISSDSPVTELVGNILNNRIASHQQLSPEEEQLLLNKIIKKQGRVDSPEEKNKEDPKNLLRGAMDVDDLTGFPFNDPSQWDDFKSGVYAQVQNRLLDIDPSLGEDKFLSDQPLSNQTKKRLGVKLQKLQGVKDVMSDPAAVSAVLQLKNMSDEEREAYFNRDPATAKYARFTYNLLTDPQNYDENGRFKMESVDDGIAEVQKQLAEGYTGRLKRGWKKLDNPKYSAAINPPAFSSIYDALDTKLKDYAKGRSPYGYMRAVAREINGMEGETLEDKVNEWLKKNIMFDEKGQPKFESYSSFPSNIDFWNESRDRSDFARGKQLKEEKLQNAQSSFADKLLSLFDSGDLTSKKMPGLKSGLKKKLDKINSFSGYDILTTPALSRYIAKAQRGALGEEDFYALMSYLEKLDKQQAAMKAGFFSDLSTPSIDVATQKDSEIRHAATMRDSLMKQYQRARPQYLGDIATRDWLLGRTSETAGDAKIDHNRWLKKVMDEYGVDVQEAQNMYEDMKAKKLEEKQEEDKQHASVSLPDQNTPSRKEDGSMNFQPYQPLSSLMLLLPPTQYKDSNVWSAEKRKSEAQKHTMQTLKEMHPEYANMSDEEIEKAEEKNREAKDRAERLQELRENSVEYSKKTDEEIEQAERAREEAKKQEEQAKEAKEKELAKRNKQVKTVTVTRGGWHGQQANHVEGYQKEGERRKKIVVKKKQTEGPKAGDDSMKNLQGIYNDSMNKGY